MVFVVGPCNVAHNGFRGIIDECFEIGLVHCIKALVVQSMGSFQEVYSIYSSSF